MLKNFTSREIRLLIGRSSIDVAQVQNLYPFLSPSILPQICRLGVPIVMRCPNYRLFCPTGLHLRNGEICEQCLTLGREFRCLINNCEEDFWRSFGYAARNAVARISRMILNSVAVFVVLTEFQKARFIANGIPAERIEVLPNTVKICSDRPPEYTGTSVSFVGRVSPEKGILEFLDAARRLPEVPFRIAGSTERMAHIVNMAPANVEFCGFLEGSSLDSFYDSSAIVVFPSKWYEGFPNTVLKAMAHAKPAIATRLGALVEIIDEGETGLLVEPGNCIDLADKIASLWCRKDECARMGANGWRKAQREYADKGFYQRLMDIYAKAAKISPTLA
jgi:glycosyltransferase involved in cell wall biosynthesis